MRMSTNYRGGRPTIMCRHGVVSAGHYLGAEAGLHILRAGGNAMDAAAAVSFALAVLEPRFGWPGPCYQRPRRRACDCHH